MQILADFNQGVGYRGFVGDKKIGRINIEFILTTDALSGNRVKRRDPVDYVVPEFDPVSYAVVSFYGRKNIHGFPFGPETTPFEFDFVVCI